MIITKTNRGVKYLYYRFWDPKSKKRVDIYCGKVGSNQAEERANELERLYLRNKMDKLRRKLREYERRGSKIESGPIRPPNGQVSLQQILRVKTRHQIVFGDSREMNEIPNGSVQLVLGSPPYFNAPFDYKGSFKGWPEYQSFVQDSACEIGRILEDGRIAAIVCDDIITEDGRYPVVAEITRAFMDLGFRYRDTIVWIKPKGYIRKSRRSGVTVQHPFPMYFYTDNVTESILIFQKKGSLKRLPERTRLESRLDLADFFDNDLYVNVWDITNVLPKRNRIEKDVAAFPYEIPYRLIKLFSYVGETVLDPWLGSGTTLQAAIDLCRNGVGYEINARLKDVILRKIGPRLKANQNRLKMTSARTGKTEIIAR